MGPITDTHILTYKANMDLAVQQKRPLLEQAFSYVADLTGRLQNFIEIYGETAVVMDLGRKADTPDIDSQAEGIWMAPRQIVWGKLMEKEDVIKKISDPQSSFIKAGAAAMVRGADLIRRDAIFGSRKIGADGGTTSAWAGDTVAVGIGHADDVTATGFNVKKILRGIRLMTERDVDTDNEQLFAFTNAQGMEELYRDITYVNTDYRSKAVLEDRTVREILGVKILTASSKTKLADYDGTTYTGAMWAKSGLWWGPFDPMDSQIPLRPDKLNRPHPYSEWWIGASRSEDYKIVKILNKK